MKIEFSRTFKKEFSKLPFSIQQKFDQRFMLFSDDIFHSLLNNNSVHPVYKESRSINITGDYRAIYVKEEDGGILFTHIGTHSELYD